MRLNGDIMIDRYDYDNIGLYPYSKGKWVLYEDVKELLDNLILTERDLLKLPIYNLYDLNNIGYHDKERSGDYFLKDHIKLLLKNKSILFNNPLTIKAPLNLKNDSKRHDIIFKNTNITYRLSVKKSHFWIYNRDTGLEIQYINNDNGIISPWDKWENFMNDFWVEILKDMK